MSIELTYLKAAALFTDERLKAKHSGVTAAVNVNSYNGDLFLWATNSYYAYVQRLYASNDDVNKCISADEIKILKTNSVDLGHKYFEQNNPRAPELLERVVMASFSIARDNPAVCDFDTAQMAAVSKAAKILGHGEPSAPFIHRANNPEHSALIQLIKGEAYIIAMPLRESDRKPLILPAWATVSK